MNVLHLDSSILGDASASRDLAADFTAHLTGQTLAAKGTPAEQRSPAQRQEAVLPETVMQEFLAADVVVVGAPMYNFSVPSQLKAWIDPIAVAGVTFRYSEKGPEGLAKGKRVIIVSTAGGKHSGTPTSVAHEGYLKLVFGFLGITDIEVVRAEGLAYGPEAREAGFSAARQDIGSLALAA
ncbi:MAG: NAD(P)H-dependent oxidoreductase [Candidatus Protistobacter heckmanni]|nr:NAD(P)H-dependent oxidoreductase [Candidatus Protistobacter heckmanni]